MASSDEELYEVQKLLDERSVSGKTWSKEYLVSWLGFGSSDDTWECVRPPRPASSSSSRALLRPLLRPLRALLRADRRRVLDRPRQNLGNTARDLIKALEASKAPKAAAAAAAASTPKKKKRAAPKASAAVADGPPAPKKAKPAVAAAAAAPAAAEDEGISAYEKERNDRIQRNQDMLKALGLFDLKEEMRKSQAAERAANRKSQGPRQTHDGPVRKSSRQLGASGGASGVDGEEDDESWRPQYKARTFFYSEGRDYGADAQVNFTLNDDS